MLVEDLADRISRLPFLLSCQHFGTDHWNRLTERFNPHLVADPLAREREHVTAFWSSQPLTDMAAFCLRTIVRQGHPVTLFTFDRLAELATKVPAGIRLGDAAEFLDRDIYEECLARAEIRYASDLFRYASLFRLGGWWLDTDIVLLKPLAFPTSHVFSTQWARPEESHICVGDVMRAPAGSPHMLALFQHSIERLHNGCTRYGAIGPELLTDYLLGQAWAELAGCVLPPTHFNAIGWRECQLLAGKDRQAFQRLADARVTGVHLWSKMWPEQGLDFAKVSPDSVVGQLKSLIDGPAPV